MKKIITYLICFICTSVFSQEEIEMNNTELNENQIDIFNQNISINLINIEYNNEIVPINISYSQTGVKVNEQEGCLGIKWRINNIGFIKQKINYISDYASPKGWFYTQNPNFQASLTTEDYNSMHYHPSNYNPSGLLEDDLSPDFYSLNMFNNSFDFFFKKNIQNESIGNPIPEFLSNSNGSKINANFNNFGLNYESINYTTAINIIDKKGNNYDFINGPLLQYGPSTRTSGNDFYLKRISNESSSDYINIEYIHTYKDLRDIYYSLGFNNELTIGSQYQSDFEQNIIHNKQFWHHYTVDENEFYPKKIESNKLKLVFEYILENKYLDVIKVFDYNNNYLFGFKFDFLDVGSKKMLSQIKKVNNTNTTIEILYSFDYYDGDSCVLDTSLQDQVYNQFTDYFGYYNGTTGASPFPFSYRSYPAGVIMPSRTFEPDINFAKQHSLFRITNKYQGITEFDYSLKRGHNETWGSNLYGGGLMVSSVKTIPLQGKTKLKIFEYDKLLGFNIIPSHILSYYCKWFQDFSVKYFSSLITELGDTYDDEDGEFLLQNIHKSGSFFGKITETIYDFDSMTLLTKKESNFNSNSEGLMRKPLLKNEIFKNNLNQIIKRTDYKYNIQNFGMIDAAEYNVESRKNLELPDTNLFCVNSFCVHVVRFFKRKKYTPIYINRCRLNEIVETLYSNNNSLETKNTFTYQSIMPNLLKTLTKTSSLGYTTIEKYYYPQDIEMQGEPLVTDLISKNIIGVPLKTETYKGTEKLSEQKTIYAQDATTSNLLQPKHVYAKKGNDIDATLEKKLTYDLYNSNGNLCQYTQENGISTSIIYGYNKTKPIAKVEYVNYSSIPTTTITDLETKSNADIDASSELILRNALDNLRTSFPNAMITTYTYDPLIGLTSVTDPKGDRQTYTYDSFGRLLNVKDKDGNTLTENDYHYKP